MLRVTSYGLRAAAQQFIGLLEFVVKVIEFLVSVAVLQCWSLLSLLGSLGYLSPNEIGLAFHGMNLLG